MFPEREPVSFFADCSFQLPKSVNSLLHQHYVEVHVVGGYSNWVWFGRRKSPFVMVYWIAVRTISCLFQVLYDVSCLAYGFVSVLLNAVFYWVVFEWTLTFTITPNSNSMVTLNNASG